jgi:hypothetical protein
LTNNVELLNAKAKAKRDMNPSDKYRRIVSNKTPPSWKTIPAMEDIPTQDSDRTVFETSLMFKEIDKGDPVLSPIGTLSRLIV